MKSLEIQNPIAIPLSDEQRAAYDAAMRGESVVANACAGSGKSHLLRAVAKNISIPCESVTFSRALADEEIAVFSGYNHITSLNFHRRGLRLCGNVDVDNKKIFKIAFTYDNEHAQAIANLVEKMKMEAYGIYENALTIEAICAKYGFDEKFIGDAKKTLADSDAMVRVVDFADMMRFPVLQGRKAILDGLILLDEVQDYTPLAWAFLRDCLTKSSSQVFMIGDPSRQMLMPFVGASADIFDVMSNYFGCTAYKLTENRRCSQAVVNAAPFKGDMVALSDAPLGEVGTRSLAEVIAEITAGEHSEAAILSEANAPLVLLGIQLLTKGVPCQMREAKLMGKILSVAIKFLDTRTTNVGDIAPKCRKAMEQAVADGEDVQERLDIIACIEALELYCLSKQILKPTFTRNGRGFRPVHPIQQALNILLTSDKGITLLTGHTAKGLEWNTVFHLAGKVKAPEQAWQEHQANCVAHVIATRAKLNFYTLAMPASA